jgi:hypothetical protein
VHLFGFYSILSLMMHGAMNVKSLNMFRASLMPIIRSLLTAAKASGLPQKRGGSSAVGRGRAGRPDHDQQHCYHHVPAVNQRLLLQLIGS